MNVMDESDQDKPPSDTTPVGYRQPPEHSRFKPGSSGNPRGRPRGRTRQAPYEAVLGMSVKVLESGGERRVTAAEAFMLQRAKRGLEGDSGAARALIHAIEEVHKHGVAPQDEVTSVVWKAVAPGSVTSALELLQMADLVDEYSEENARVRLKDWIVEAALERSAKQPLAEQKMDTVRTSSSIG